LLPRRNILYNHSLPRSPYPTANALPAALGAIMTRNGAACGLLLVVSLPALAADAIDADALRPGLVATYRDAARAVPAEIVRLEPTIALALKAGEAAHPRLAADGGGVRWEGYLNVVRAGDYRFRALVRGQFRLNIAGKDVLAAEVKGEAPALQEGAEVRLEPGWQPLVAEFTRLPGAARLEVFWESKGFRSEPLPHEPLRHLPARAPARLAADAAADQGRFLVEERNCFACHRPDEKDRVAAGLTGRQGPDLSKIGERVYAAWLYRWLEAPDRMRPGAVMPRLFADDEAGKAERYAAARYLASLGGPLAPERTDRNRPKPNAARGEKLFGSVGCLACHGERTKDKGQRTKEEEGGVSSFVLGPSSFPLSGLGAKTTTTKLAAYLANPLAVDPGGRMPHMLLQRPEAEDLAGYLCRDGAGAETEMPAPPAPAHVLAAFRRVEDRLAELAAFQKLPPDTQMIDLGQRVVIAKGCNNCHTIAPGGKPFASVLATTSFDGIKKAGAGERGCLGSTPAKEGRAPWFALSAAERASVRRFLADGTTGAGSPAPAFAARVALRRFNCLACHMRDGEGGLSTELVEELRKYEKAENAEAVVPPPLTGVAHKLRTPWLRGVLTEVKRARPWMGLRMPQFGADNVGRLPEALAALEGTEPDDKVHAVAITAARVTAGRQLVGKSAFGCISCHDFAGLANSGTRGPDLAAMNERVRYDWYARWLEQPQRLSPGTRMPSVFTNGKSLVESVLGGSGDAQAEAMWAYLSLGPGLPLPDGLEPASARGIILTVKDRPVLLRTFMPDAGARAVVVGYPGNVSVAFDAVTCRLAYAWSGNFLDAAPAWDGRGGNPAKVLGPRFWTGPAGCPLAVSDSKEPPDFAAQSRDPAYGAAVPEGKVYDGPRQLAFEGYTTDKEGMPTFRYRLQAADPNPVEVTERPEPLRSGVGVGVARRFTVKAAASQMAWLFAGETKREPRLLDAKAAPLALDLKAGEVELPAAGRALVLPQDGDKVIVLALSAAPEGACWRLRKLDARWQVLLRLPAGSASARVVTWAPYRDDPALLKELLSAPERP
jgi:mono/diheme cytochrome c family protein